VIVSLRNKHIEPLLLWGYVVGYTVIHIIFPDRVLRYSYPLLPFLCALLFWPALVMQGRIPKIKKVMSAATICGLFVYIVFNTAHNGGKYLDSMRWDKPERRVVAEWFNTRVNHPVVVYAFEYWVSEYYTDNPNVTYASTVRPLSWTQDLCRYDEDVYIVLSLQTEERGSYFDHLNGIDYFKKLSSNKENSRYLTLIKTIVMNTSEGTSRWAKIYRFNKAPPEWCAAL
jgi:hypothetical protein